jgi:hypothetical protein
MFCQWFLQQCGTNPNLHVFVIFMDGAQCTRDLIQIFTINVYGQMKTHTRFFHHIGNSGSPSTSAPAFVVIIYSDLTYFKTGVQSGITNQEISVHDFLADVTLSQHFSLVARRYWG